MWVCRNFFTIKWPLDIKATGIYNKIWLKKKTIKTLFHRWSYGGGNLRAGLESTFGGPSHGAIQRHENRLSISGEGRRKKMLTFFCYWHWSSCKMGQHVKSNIFFSQRFLYLIPVLGQKPLAKSPQTKATGQKTPQSENHLGQKPSKQNSPDAKCPPKQFVPCDQFPPVKKLWFVCAGG